MSEEATEFAVDCIFICSSNGPISFQTFPGCCFVAIWREKEEIQNENTLCVDSFPASKFAVGGPDPVFADY
jgi:hypothetical protein